jgi:cytochrome P450
VREIVDALLDDVTQRTAPVDLVESFALAVPSMVICELLGVPAEDREFFHGCAVQVVNLTSTVEQIGTRTGGCSRTSTISSRRERDRRDDPLSRLAAQQQLEV